MRGVWGNPWGFESPLRHHLKPRKRKCLTVKVSILMSAEFQVSKAEPVATFLPLDFMQGFDIGISSFITPFSAVFHFAVPGLT